MNALETQVGGDHYKSMPIQPMEFSMANGLDACQHTIVKYVTRFRQKGGVQDLEKARHVIDMLIEFERKASSKTAANDNAAPPSIFDLHGGGWTPMDSSEPIPVGCVDLLFKDGSIALGSEIGPLAPFVAVGFRTARKECCSPKALLLCKGCPHRV